MRWAGNPDRQLNSMGTSGQSFEPALPPWQGYAQKLDVLPLDYQRRPFSEEILLPQELLGIS